MHPLPGQEPSGTADELSGGSDRPGWSRRRRWLLVALLVAVTAAAGGAQWESRRQLDALLLAASDVERVVQDSRRSLAGLVHYSSALLTRTDLAPEQRAAVLGTLAADAQRYPPRTQAPRAALAGVRPLPWDSDLREARAAYVARLDAWTALVEAAQDDPLRLLYERRDTRDQRQAAARTLEAAADGRAAEQVAALQRDLLGR
jgi:hypothetical protein